VSAYLVGDHMVATREGATAKRQVVTDINGASGPCVQVRITESNGAEEVGESYWEFPHILDHYYAIEANPPQVTTTKENTMNTTDITRTESIDVSVGDVFIYSPTSTFPATYVVVEVDPTSDKSIGVRRLATLYGLGVSEADRRHVEFVHPDSFSSYTHLRPVDAQPTTVEVVERTIEHQYVVGDTYVHPDTYSEGTEYTITGVGIEAKIPVYYTTPGSFDWISIIDGAENLKLVGGPTLEAREAEAIANLTPKLVLETALGLIGTEERWVKGAYRETRWADDGDEERAWDCFCSIGAINSVVTGQATVTPEKDHPARAAWEGAIEAYVETIGESPRVDHWDGPMVNDSAVISFNDRDDTTYDKVKAAFQGGIAKLVLS
jgi:hypothetical protein